MYFIRRYRYALLFIGMLVFCSIMVVRQIGLNQSRHVELREALILLHSRGYTNQASRLFTKLVDDIPNLGNKQLMDDFQRTVMLVDPSSPQTNNPVWRYHWTVSNELEKRSESTLRRALKLAGESSK